MNLLRVYVSPEITIVVLAEEIVRTSQPGSGEGELPIQPFFL